ncbi:MAG: hypothetical protein ACPGU7_04855 [Gammaproteobacteria bacterium]
MSFTPCPKCGYDGPVRISSWKHLRIAAVLWLLPLVFATQGLWPFGILIALGYTLWAYFDAPRACPRCGKPHPW